MGLTNTNSSNTHDSNSHNGNHDNKPNSNNNNNVLIVHGEPGRGKSALMAKVSATCLDSLRKERNDFVFVHAADACPGSNDLEAMLRRMQSNVRMYCKKVAKEKRQE